MIYTHLIIALALLQFLYFGIEVGRAREKYGVHAPATTGNEVFERYFRVQMNTLEQLVIFVPSMLIVSHYVDPRIPAALGVIFLIGRAVYFRAYTRAPASRSIGFSLSMIPNLILLIGALVAPIVQLVRG